MTTRHYALSVPVHITVDDDGYITIRGDLSELPLDESAELYEDETATEPLTYTDEQIESDQSMVDEFGSTHELFIDDHAVLWSTTKEA